MYIRPALLAIRGQTTLSYDSFHNTLLIELVLLWQALRKYVKSFNSTSIIFAPHALACYIYTSPCLKCLWFLFLLIASVTARRQSDDIVVRIFLYPYVYRPQIFSRLFRPTQARGGRQHCPCGARYSTKHLLLRCRLLNPHRHLLHNLPFHLIFRDRIGGKALAAFLHATQVLLRPLPPRPYPP